MRCSHDLRCLKHKIVMIGDSLVGKTSLMHRLTRDVFLKSCQSTIGTGCGTWSTVVDQDPVYLQIWDTAGQERYRSLGGIFYRNAEAAIVVFSKSDPKSAKSVESWVSQFRAIMGTSPFIAIVANKADIDEAQFEKTNIDLQSYSSDFDSDFSSNHLTHSSDFSDNSSGMNGFTSSSNCSSLTDSALISSPSIPQLNSASLESNELIDSLLNDDDNQNKFDVQKWAKEKGFFYIETSAKTGKNVQELFQTVARNIAMKLEVPSKLIFPPATFLAVQGAKETYNQCC